MRGIHMGVTPAVADFLRECPCQDRPHLQNEYDLQMRGDTINPVIRRRSRTLQLSARCLQVQEKGILARGCEQVSQARLGGEPAKQLKTCP